MKILIALVLLAFMGAGKAFAQIPAEWQAAAQAVIGDLERDTPLASKPWTNETTQGWHLARAWRKHNNGNIEIILAEYLTFVAVCRSGCAGSTIMGQGYVAVAEQAKALRAQQGGPYALVANSNAWLAGIADPTGAAAKNAALWGKDIDMAAADYATSNIYALFWLLARAKGTPVEQADTFAKYAIFVQLQGWIGARCLDISKVATVIGAPPKIESCK
ncbi:hypothetical protein [Reyranella sp.]|uniref:hypothetical protein n=1 Tax=Reyranella sp. TaxID=1929291 RepID=UPI003784FCF1